MKIITASLTFVVVASSAALAQDRIYKWTEPDGTVHYSNEPQRVPQTGNAQETTGEEIGVLPTDPKPAPTPPSREQLEERKLVAEVRKAEADAYRAEVEAESIQKRSDEQWRLAFRAAYEKIERLERELEEERAILQVAGMPVIGRTVIYVRPLAHNGVVIDDRYDRAKVRVPQLEREIVEARYELEELERRASFAGVPRNLRRRY